jgi:hypothetical protein
LIKQGLLSVVGDIHLSVLMLHTDQEKNHAGLQRVHFLELILLQDKCFFGYWHARRSFKTGFNLASDINAEPGIGKYMKDILLCYQVRAQIASATEPKSGVSAGIKLKFRFHCIGFSCY